MAGRFYPSRVLGGRGPPVYNDPMRLRLALGVALLGIALSSPAAEVWVLRIDGEIGRGTVSYLRKGLAEAEGAGAAAVVVEFATPGATSTRRSPAGTSSSGPGSGRSRM